MERSPYVLGLDLGARSIGWALLDLEQGQPVGVRATGVRCFEAGVEGNLDEGRDEARGQKRRAARAARRQIDRRTDRRRKILRTLCDAGVFPPPQSWDGGSVASHLEAFDRDLRARQLLSNDPLDAHRMHYRLRAEALDRPLPLSDFARILYQVAQRRGFQSNRKAKRRDDQEEGQVRAAIGELEKAIGESGSRTLGEYLSTLDPHQARIRSRWTARTMFEDEFELLWQSQSRFHTELTDDLHRALREAMFFQRPLRSQKGRVGECELVAGRKRAPLACREAQRFRVLQTVNNLRLTEPGTAERSLTASERESLLGALLERGDLTIAKAKRALGVSRESELNLERGGEKRLVGHRTDSKLRSLFKESWGGLKEEERTGIVDALLSIEEPLAVVRKAMADWGLDEPAATALAEMDFEKGYAAFSRAAIKRLLPRMEEGIDVESARRELFPESVAVRSEADMLPRVEAALPHLRNPAVARTLTELRKVVNAIVAEHGRPELIRLELARDLRNGRERRRQMTKTARQREQERERAKAEIRRLGGPEYPSRSDVEKYLLGEECGWQCPYTGHGISPSAEFGGNPQFDVEHIWPLSRSLDNSFLNKTLCHHEENRSRKRGRTPREAYGADSGRMEQILDRVAKFSGSARMVKLSRFASDEIPADFSLRHLNDTRFATRLALRYLGVLYGGTVDAAGKRRVQAGTGGLTAIVRNELGLNGILNDGGFKTRDDHRHHAVDAIAVALQDAGLAQRLQKAARDAPSSGRRSFAPIESPWESFTDQVREAVGAIVVSHRPRRKISGALHEETHYSREIRGLSPGTGSAGVARRVRKRVHELSTSMIDAIADRAVRESVREKLSELGGDPKRLEADPPHLSGGAGRPVPIRKVRVDVKGSPITIGRGARQRHVETGANHHLAVVARLDADGHDVEWEGHLVTLLEAHRRLVAGEEIVRRDYGPGCRFLFSLSSGDAIEMDGESRQRELWLVRTVWLSGNTARVECSPAADARDKGTMKRSRVLRQPVLSSLRKAHARRVVVSPIGKVHALNA